MLFASVLSRNDCDLPLHPPSLPPFLPQISLDEDKLSLLFSLLHSEDVDEAEAAAKVVLGLCANLEAAAAVAM